MFLNYLKFFFSLFLKKINMPKYFLHIYLQQTFNNFVVKT